MRKSALYLASLGFRKRSFVEFDLNAQERCQRANKVAGFYWTRQSPCRVIMSVNISTFRDASKRDRTDSRQRGVELRENKKASYNYQQCKLSEFSDR